MHRDVLGVGAGLCLIYLAFAASASLRDGTGWAFFVSGGAVLPFVGLVVVAALATQGRAPKGLIALLQAGYPLAFWPLLYGGAVAIVQLDPSRYQDAWIERLDGWLMGYGDTGLPGWPLGGPLEELASGLYLSYYLVVPAGFFWAWLRRGRVEATGYALAVLIAFAACAVVWILMPTGGHFIDGAPNTEPGGPLTAMARGIYEANPHFAAALPSSHVAIAVVSAGMVHRLGGTALLWIWAVGVAWSTIYGQYHYMLDAPTGVMAGALGIGWYVALLRRAEAERADIGAGARPRDVPRDAG